MKKISLYSLFAMAAVTVLFGCLPEDHNTYEGPSLTEFKNHTLGMVSTGSNSLASRGIVTSPSSQVQTDSSRTILINTRTTDTIYVQLIGPQQSSAIDVPFTIRSSSTAVEGTHYNMVPAGNRKVTIPANSSVGYLLYQPVANSMTTVGDTRTLKFDLASTGVVKPSPNYSKFLILLKR